MTIRQGEIYWVELGEPRGSAPGYRHPHVVISNDVFNRSRLRTVVLSALTSNLVHASSPGNVLLKKGEANLPKDSVVNVTQLVTLDKEDLSERIGRLSPAQFEEVLTGVLLVLEPREM
ncbi:MAG: type II toxin-antitoxin system PemK/MazF family toxin [bacterium]